MIWLFTIKKYKDLANLTKASFCITTINLSSDLPKKVEKILVKMFYTSLHIAQKDYNGADVDYPDLTLSSPIKKNLFQ